MTHNSDSDDVDEQIAALKRKRDALKNTAAAPVIDERIAALEDSTKAAALEGIDPGDSEAVEERIAVLERKRDALKNTAAAPVIDERIAALEEVA